MALKIGLTQREIADSVGVAKSSVQHIVAQSRQVGMEWETIKQIQDSEIERLLFPRIRRTPTRIEPEWPQVGQELLKKGNTLATLWYDYRILHTNGFSYSSFCQNFRKWQRSKSHTMRLHHPAGKRMFVDFSGLKVPWRDPTTGQLNEAEIFVAVLGASSYTFVEAVKDQSSQSWIGSHINAFDFFGGVSETIVPDNLKSGVSRSCRYDPDTNPAYQAFADHYMTAVIPARPYRPRDKAKAEVAVQVAQRWILSILRRQEFTSIDCINCCIPPLLERLNNKKMKHLDVSRRELFEKTDRPALKPLPSEKFVVPTWKIVRVTKDYHVEMERHYYSVPYRFVGKEVDVKASNSIVEIFEGCQRIATHPQQHGSVGQYTTELEHMPPAHRAYAEWTQDKILFFADEAGLNVGDFCRRIIRARNHPEQGFRSCVGILRLGEVYGSEKLEKACEIALGMRSFRYRTVQDILRRETDQKKTAAKTSSSMAIEHHENIRGANYYT